MNNCYRVKSSTPHTRPCNGVVPSALSGRERVERGKADLESMPRTKTPVCPGGSRFAFRFMFESFLPYMCFNGVLFKKKLKAVSFHLSHPQFQCQRVVMTEE